MKTNCMDCEYKHFFIGNNCNDSLECMHADAQISWEDDPDYDEYEYDYSNSDGYRYIISLGRNTPKQVTPPDFCPLNKKE